MNIHFKDNRLLNDLQNRTIVKSEVGSVLYDLKGKNSDTDYLSIYIEEEYNLASFTWEHHQLQFKKEKVDENFTSLQGFIRNALTGDATINIELIFSGALKDTPLQFLYDYRKHFLTYNVVKSYLGLAKRDLKMLKKSTKNFRKFDAEDAKKMVHFMRGIKTASNILTENRVNLTEDESLYFSYLKFNYAGISFEEKIDLVDKYEDLMNRTREKANKMLDNGDISKFMTPQIMGEIDAKVSEMTLNYNKENGSMINYHNIFYEALNGVEY